MAICPDGAHSRRACSITGAGGAALSAGDIITGEANLRAISMQNGLARVKYTRPAGSEPAACHLDVNTGHTSEGHEDLWIQATTDHYGDWSFFAAPIESTCDRVKVIEATADAVEIALIWDDHRLDVAYLGGSGVLWRDDGNVPFYDQWNGISNRFRYLTGIEVTKVVRIERGREGYFIGWHSDPHLGPPPDRLYIGSPDNNEPAWAERELGTGGGDAVQFSSAGFAGYFPAWSERAVWATAETQNGSAYTERHWWTGIDDPTYGAMATVAFAQTQNAGFPGQQLVGPWWVAGIPGSDVTGVGAVCRYMVFQNPVESGGWQFMPTPNRAASVAHFCNNWPTADGRVERFQVFVGAFPYEAVATAVAVAGYSGTVQYGNEPRAPLRARIAATAAALVWPSS